MLEIRYEYLIAVHNILSCLKLNKKVLINLDNNFLIKYLIEIYNISIRSKLKKKSENAKVIKD